MPVNYVLITAIVEIILILIIIKAKKKNVKMNGNVNDIWVGTTKNFSKISFLFIF